MKINSKIELVVSSDGRLDYPGQSYNYKQLEKSEYDFYEF